MPYGKILKYVMSDDEFQVLFLKFLLECNTESTSLEFHLLHLFHCLWGAVITMRIQRTALISKIKSAQILKLKL